MKKITEELLRLVSDFTGSFKGAFNIREDGGCAGRQSSEHIRIEGKAGAPGLVIHVAAGTAGETVYIPACVTHGAVDDQVYNDFYIGEGADVTIVAGCGVHNEGEESARHNGIHKFILEKGAHVVYQEKHIGTGTGTGLRAIDPVTEAELSEDAILEIDTLQISGVDRATRKMTAVLGERARLIVRERLMTDHDEQAETAFRVTLVGAQASADVVSRSVARGRSHQVFDAYMRGENRVTGHMSCDAILAEQGTVLATPSLDAAHVDAQLIHEAAIGRIAGEQLLKLRTLGLSEQAAEEKIIAGFLK
ncbi:MAG: SufD family Fe-S cluster assembly protein [Clostridia bacterium]